MPITTAAAIGIAAVGAVGQVVAADKQASAASGAAKAQRAAAGQQQSLALAEAESPQELAALGQALGAQEKSLARQERLVAALDPAILEASNQALALLRGEESKALAPLQAQRAKQRQQLLNTLREQLGPGAETSSQGLAALSNFDLETQSLSSGQQSQTLGQLFNIAQAGSDNRLQRTAQGFQNIAQGFGAAANRRVNAATGTGGAVTDSAGADFVGDQIRGAAQSQAFGGLTQIGTAAALGGFGGGAAAPAAAGGSKFGLTALPG